MEFYCIIQFATTTVKQTVTSLTSPLLIITKMNTFNQCQLSNAPTLSFNPVCFKSSPPFFRGMIFFANLHLSHSNKSQFSTYLVIENLLQTPTEGPQAISVPSLFSYSELYYILYIIFLFSSSFNDHYDRLSYHQATSRTDTDKEKE